MSLADNFMLATQLVNLRWPTDRKLLAQVIGCPLEPDLGMGDMGGSIDMQAGMLDGYYGPDGGGYGQQWGGSGLHGVMPHGRDYATASHGATMHDQSSSWGSNTWNAGMCHGGGNPGGSPGRRASRGGRPAKSVAVAREEQVQQDRLALFGDRLKELDALSSQMSRELHGTQQVLSASFGRTTHSIALHL
jgi:hypothetical protein